jgi:type I restriction enzyme M protein
MTHFEKFFNLLPKRGYFDRSWSVPAEEIVAKNYDLKAVNPNRKIQYDTRTPQELLSIIEAESDEIENILYRLKNNIFKTLTFMIKVGYYSSFW